MAPVRFVAIISIAQVLIFASAHSFLTWPQPITPYSCRVGGPKEFLFNCRGPCFLHHNLDANPPKSNFYPEKIGNKRYPGGGKPAATFSRGERVKIKYARNNHSPGGFNRFTLVRPEDTMNRAAHDKNVFWYSCWGAEFSEATPAELKRDKYGFNIAGGDRFRKNGPAQGYYTADVVIPKCVPDGKYIFSMLWYGGTGGGIESNDPRHPGQWSLFGDYWSCSFIEIKGGPKADSCEVVFNADSKYSKDKCFSSVDRPGSPNCKATVEDPQSFSDECQCKVEPCKNKKNERVRGKYMVPASFNGKKPKPLTPANWGGKVMQKQLTTRKGKPSYEELRAMYEKLKEEVEDGTYIEESKTCSPELFNRCKKACTA